MIEWRNYQILGIPSWADRDDAKRAYHQLAKRFHPDLNKHPDATARFIELRNAYQAIDIDIQHRDLTDYPYANARI